MLVWLSMLTAVAVLWFVIPDSIGEKKKKLMFLTFSGIIVVFLVGGRCVERTASADVLAYYRLYECAIDDNIEHLMRSHQMDWGYTVFNKILAFFIPWPQFIVYLEAAFVTLSVFRFLYINVKDVYLGVIVYFCTGAWAFMTSGFRQAFAIGICLFAFEFMKKKTFKADLIALLLIFVASLCHVTSWVFAAAFVFRNIRMSKKVVLISISVTIVAFLGVELITDVVERVMDYGFTGDYEGSIIGGIVPIFIFAMTLLFSFLASKTDKVFFDKHNFMMVMVFLGLCMYFFRYNTTILERVSYYFTIFHCALLPSALGQIKDFKTKNVIKAICVAFCFGLFVYRMADTNDYYFYWM